jgi:hypothetical protein
MRCPLVPREQASHQWVGEVTKPVANPVMIAQIVSKRAFKQLLPVVFVQKGFFFMTVSFLLSIQKRTKVVRKTITTKRTTGFEPSPTPEALI